MRKRPDMTESPSTGSGGSLPSFVLTAFLYIERSCARIIPIDNLHLLSIHIFQYAIPELTRALGELMYALGDAGAAMAPHTGVAMYSQRCDCCARLGIRGLLWRSHTGAVAYGLWWSCHVRSMLSTGRLS